VSNTVHPIATQSALEQRGHRFDRLWIFDAVGLARCLNCGRTWRFRSADNQFGAMLSRWLRLLEPAGWTITFDLPITPGLDEVARLTEVEMLLWNGEPCPGPPTRDYPGTIENALYRLIALGVLDSSERDAALAGTIPTRNLVLSS
jgi:hypothetical protein